MSATECLVMMEWMMVGTDLLDYHYFFIILVFFGQLIVGFEWRAAVGKEGFGWFEQSGGLRLIIAVTQMVFVVITAGFIMMERVCGIYTTFSFRQRV